MRYEIYKKKEEKESEKVVRLMLVEKDGEIILQAVDEEGKRVPSGDLLTFYTDQRRPSLVALVNEDLGFDLDDEGHLEFRFE